MPVRFVAGDVIITNGAPSLILASAAEWLANAPSDPLPRDEDGNLRAGMGSDFVMIAGLLAVDAHRCGLLLGSLPTVIHVNGGEGPAPKLGWLLANLAQERAQQRAGAEMAVDHLAKLMFVEALRLHIDSQSSETTGWLTALEDPRLSIALRNIHADPAHPWTLEELAKTSGMSRTSFAVRFRNAVGSPPLTYVLNWRMRLAEHDLIKTDRSVADIAWSLGYGSESAFSNAFSRVTGLSPGRFRKVAEPGDAPGQRAPHGSQAREIQEQRRDKRSPHAHIPRFDAAPAAAKTEAL